MDNPGTLQNNFLSTRGTKRSGDGKSTLQQAGSLSSTNNPQGLALYFSLMKNKKMPEGKKTVPKSKQVVMRSPSSLDRQSERSDCRLSQAELANKENYRRIGNIAKFTASKILFQDDRRGKK